MNTTMSDPGPSAADASILCTPYDDERSGSLRGGRFYPLHAIDRPDLFLDLADDGLLDLLRGGAGVGNHHLNEIQRRVGEHFLNEVARGEQTGEQEERHEEVRRNGIARHEPDRSSSVCQVAPGIHGPRAPGSAFVRVVVAHFMGNRCTVPCEGARWPGGQRRVEGIGCFGPGSRRPGRPRLAVRQMRASLRPTGSATARQLYLKRHRAGSPTPGEVWRARLKRTVGGGTE